MLNSGSIEGFSWEVIEHNDSFLGCEIFCKDVEQFPEEVGLVERGEVGEIGGKFLVLGDKNNISTSEETQIFLIKIFSPVIMLQRFAYFAGNLFATRLTKWLSFFFPSYLSWFISKFLFLILITLISESPCTIQYWTVLKYHLPFYITLTIISKVSFSLSLHIYQKYILVYSFIKSKPSKKKKKVSLHPFFIVTQIKIILFIMA